MLHCYLRNWKTQERELLLRDQQVKKNSIVLDFLS